MVSYGTGGEYCARCHTVVKTETTTYCGRVRVRTPYLEFGPISTRVLSLALLFERMLSRRELILLGLVFVLTLPAVTTRLYASDEIQYFAWLRSVAFDHDANFENEYQHFYDAGVSQSPGFHETFLERTTESGRRINYTTPGSALLWSPFYGVAHLVALVGGAPADGFSHPYIAAVTYGSALYGFLAVLFSALAARRVVGNGIGASVCVAIGSPLLFYTYLAPGFGHATSAFAVSLFFWTWIRVRERWSLGGAIVLGLAGGLMALVREQDVLLALAPALDFLVDGFRPKVRHPAPAVRWPVLVGAAGAIGFGLVYSVQLLAYTAVNGHPWAHRDGRPEDDLDLPARPVGPLQSRVWLLRLDPPGDRVCRRASSFSGGAEPAALLRPIGSRIAMLDESPRSRC